MRSTVFNPFKQQRASKVEIKIGAYRGVEYQVLYIQVVSVWPPASVVRGGVGVDKLGRSGVGLTEYPSVKAGVDGRLELLFEIVGIPLPRRLPRTVCRTPEIDQGTLVALQQKRPRFIDQLLNGMQVDVDCPLRVNVLIKTEKVFFRCKIERCTTAKTLRKNFEQPSAVSALRGAVSADQIERERVVITDLAFEPLFHQ
ncbi:hypothetical protein D3C77_272390 [compost metagenome]